MLAAWSLGAVELIISEHILTELVATFEQSYFAQRLSSEQRAANLALLRSGASLTPITMRVSGAATHPEDDLILAAAVSASADYLVTGDSKLLKLGSHQGIRIVSPRVFLEVLARH